MAVSRPLFQNGAPPCQTWSGALASNDREHSGMDMIDMYNFLNHDALDMFGV